jgi:hypothetical protein
MTPAWGKDKIAVFPFVMKVPGYGPEYAASVDDIFVAALVQTKMFDVVERGQMSKILQEQKFSQSAAVDDSSAAQMGKLLGVKEVVVGTITKMQVERYSAVLFKVYKAEVEIQARLVNIETGAVEFADSFTGSNTVAEEARTRPNPSIFSTAMQDAVNKVVGKMISDITFEGEIVQVEGDNVVIDLTHDCGIAPENIVKVIAVKNLVTPKKVIKMREEMGELKITEVAAEYCKAKITKGKGAIKLGDIVVYKKGG